MLPKTFVMVDRPFWHDLDPTTGRPVMSMTPTDRNTRGTYLLDNGQEIQIPREEEPAQPLNAERTYRAAGSPIEPVGDPLTAGVGPGSWSVLRPDHADLDHHGEPKIVPLSQRNLCASARNIRQTLRFVPGDCGLNIMPLFHIHGLIAGVLAPISAGSEVFCSPGFDALKFFGWIWLDREQSALACDSPSHMGR